MAVRLSVLCIVHSSFPEIFLVPISVIFQADPGPWNMNQPFPIINSPGECVQLQLKILWLCKRCPFKSYKITACISILCKTFVRCSGSVVVRALCYNPGHGLEIRWGFLNPILFAICICTFSKLVWGLCAMAWGRVLTSALPYLLGLWVWWGLGE
jgi:hypothetical protein